MNKILKITIFAIIFIMILGMNFVVNADGSFSVSTSNLTIQKGKTATFSITAKDCGGQFSISSSDSSVATVNLSSEWIESDSKTITVVAKKTGTVTVTVEAQDVASKDGKAVITGTKTVEINVTDTSEKKEETKTEEKKTEETKKSDNANLKTLGVTPKEYDFSGFSKNKTSYSVTIPSNVDSLNVIAKAEDSKAKVNISGNKNLEVGTNTIKVEVTAENGKTTKTYEVSVTKLATEDEKPGNLLDEDNKNTTKLYLKSLSIEGLELTPSFDKNIFSYEATIDMDTKDLSKINVNAAAENIDSTVEITGNTDLKEGENTVNVIVKSKSSSEQTVYQITVNKVSKASEITTNKKKGIKRETLIIVLYIACLIIIFAILILKKTKNKKLDNNYKDIDENTNSSNLMDDIYKKKNNGEELNDFEKQTINDIESENDRIFKKNKNSILYNQQDDDSNDRKKGRHF